MNADLGVGKSPGLDGPEEDSSMIGIDGSIEEPARPVWNGPFPLSYTIPDEIYEENLFTSYIDGSIE